MVRLLNEPTAAALVYDRLVARQIAPRALRTVSNGADSADSADSADGPNGADSVPAAAGRSDHPQRILVYDLGGGTFDVTVLDLDSSGGLPRFRVLSTSGVARLGGDDFDRLLAEHLAGHLREQAGRELPQDLRLAARLEDAAERAKVDLSSRPFARVIEEALLGARHLDLEVSRQDFEELIETLLASTLAEVDGTLAEARLAAEQIDRVVLVGGSTHIPRVQELLAGRFSCPVEHAVDPALCVALGAAVQGAILAGEVFDHILVDVAAHSLGVKTMDNVLAGGRGGDWTADFFSTVIRRNSQVPATRSEPYYTMVNDQECVAVEVYQGRASLQREHADRRVPVPAPAGARGQPGPGRIPLRPGRHHPRRRPPEGHRQPQGSDPLHPHAGAGADRHGRSGGELHPAQGQGAGRELLPQARSGSASARRPGPTSSCWPIRRPTPARSTGPRRAPGSAERGGRGPGGARERAMRPEMKTVS